MILREWAWVGPCDVTKRYFRGHAKQAVRATKQPLLSGSLQSSGKKDSFLEFEPAPDERSPVLEKNRSSKLKPSHFIEYFQLQKRCHKVYVLSLHFSVWCLFCNRQWWLHQCPSRLREKSSFLLFSELVGFVATAGEILSCGFRPGRVKSFWCQSFGLGAAAVQKIFIHPSIHPSVHLFIYLFFWEVFAAPYF